MANNPIDGKVPRIDGNTRIPQLRTAKPSKIAKPIVGSKSPSLPKSLSNEKICQASNLVQKTNFTFQSKFTRPTIKMSEKQKEKSTDECVKQSDVLPNTSHMDIDNNLTQTIESQGNNRPSLIRSNTYVTDTDASSSERIELSGSENSKSNDLGQNVISKLKQQTFTSVDEPNVNVTSIVDDANVICNRTVLLDVDNQCSTFNKTPVSLNITRTNDITHSISSSIETTELSGNGNNKSNDLGHNVINKLKQQTFTSVERPNRVSISPIVGDLPSTRYKSLRQKLENQNLCSTPFNKTALLSHISTKNINYKVSPVSLDITGTEKDRQPLDVDQTNNPHWPSVRYSSLIDEISEVEMVDNTVTDITVTETKPPKMPTNNIRLPSVDYSRRISEISEIELVDNTNSSLDHSTLVFMDSTTNDITRDSAQSTSVPVDIPKRNSFGQDGSEWIGDCSIELCDSSVASSVPNIESTDHLRKDNSFDDKSLSILTPDQMKEFLDSNTNLNLDLPLFPDKIPIQCRVDQTPSPEELPLDPVGIKTDVSDILMANDHVANGPYDNHEHQHSQTESYSKADQMTKSTASKVSNSFITSITSITSLDTGYQGDGEMSRPASRGGDHSPSNMPRAHPMRPIIACDPSYVNNQNIAIVRRQDPMTDSDFFTESDAEDAINRGDRRAQIIDGQLYAPMVQGANVYVNQQPSTEDSCMESSGVFTDIENRVDDDLLMIRQEHDSDMSPDGSTDTIKSSNSRYNSKLNSTVIVAHTDTGLNIQGHSMSESTTSTINSNCEKGGDQQSVISDDSINSVQSRVSKSNDNLQSGNLKKTTPNRKQNKNDVNVALKKHEMSKRVVLNDDNINVVSSNEVKNVCDIVGNCENTRPISKTPQRKITPNKWDAVMNKIASNKSTGKSKNYSEVKSKVTCGLPKKDSTGLEKSTNVDVFFVTTTPRRSYPLSTKRGRTNSQQSSQSDVSENSIAPKSRPISSSVTRSSKKRDVNIINNTPTNTSAKKSNGKCGKIKPTSLQKHFDQSGTPSLSSSPVSCEQKSSPPTKRILSRRSLTNSGVTPLKDHNRHFDSVAPISPVAPPSKLSNSPKPTKRFQSTISNGIHNDAVHADGNLHKKTLASQIDKSENNGKIVNSSRGKICKTRSVVTVTKATSTIDIPDENLIHANKGIDALSVLVQYLAFDLDAFSVPNLKKSKENATQLLLETKSELDHLRLNYAKLEDELVAKEQYFSTREGGILEDHRNEISEIQCKQKQINENYENLIISFESQLANKDKKITELEANSILAKNNEKELKEQIRLLTSTENELREKVFASEKQFSERLQLASMKERELTEKLILNKKEFDEKERIYYEKLNIAQDELLLLRNFRDTNGTTKDQPRNLSDIQSYEYVLELKQNKISELQKQNHELEKDASMLPVIMAKLSAAESRMEDLEIQLKTKIEGEKELTIKNKHLEDSLKYEIQNNTRVSLDNEQLKYRLRTNSERFSSAISELSKTHQDFNQSDIFTGPSCSTPTTADLSRPTSPVIKGVIEKPASVSYVLEINDEESPEELASRLIRRAGSFRLNTLERKKRKSQQANVLSQSASATSILRQHSECNSTSPKIEISSRVRSKSINSKPNSPSNGTESFDKRHLRHSRNLPLLDEPVSSSTPNSKQFRSVISNNSKDIQLSEESETECSPVFYRSNSDNGQISNSRRSKHTKRGLITCSTSALTSQRPDLCPSMPVHPVVKELQKCEQIKESAGEAMVSGTNSEDESSTASSDASSQSSSSERHRSAAYQDILHHIAASLSRTDDYNNDTIIGEANNTQMEIGTPMEVSWSEDVDHFANDSAV